MPSFWLFTKATLDELLFNKSIHLISSRSFRSFSKEILYCPPYVITYIIYHEDWYHTYLVTWNVFFYKLHFVLRLINLREYVCNINIWTLSDQCEFLIQQLSASSKVIDRFQDMMFNVRFLQTIDEQFIFRVWCPLLFSIYML